MLEAFINGMLYYHPFAFARVLDGFILGRIRFRILLTESMPLVNDLY
jgi:hypothetical protein